MSNKSKPSLTIKIAPPSVLVVDDEEPLRHALARILRSQCDIETREAQDGLRAFSILEQRRFDVIVCDLDLGFGPDGMRVLEQCRDRWPLMRRVLYTGKSAAEQFDAGVADLVLDKMIDSSQVAEHICNLAKQGRQ